jgi:hypothetical protein
MRRLYIGIDNGSSGAIATLRSDGSVFRVDPMPPTDVDLYALLGALGPASLAPYLAGPAHVFAYLEHAQAFPKMGVTGAFNYGRGYGAVQMALVAAGIAFDIVTPRKWQAALGSLTGGDKNVSKRRAQQLFPGMTITHAIADALLIAEFCRRVRGAHGQEESASAQHTSEAQREPEQRQRQPFEGYNPPGRTRRR